MSDLIGRALPANLVDLFTNRLTTVVVATVDNDGLPHTAPYNQLVAVDPGRLRLAINRQDETYRALRDYGLTMIAVLEEGDIAAGIKGKARVLRERMDTNCNLAVVEIEVEEIKRDNSPTHYVLSGVRTRHRGEPFLLRQRQIMAELRS
ncbi:MAG: pyridoxamine 5'-phosphate oxidase family protein [Bacteroidota bacterium]